MFEGETFTYLTNDEDPVTLQDLELVNCVFQGCTLWTLKDPAHRALVNNVSLTECEIIGEGSNIPGAVVEDCNVQGLKTGGLLRIDGCAFKHVKLSGAIGRVMITDSEGGRERVVPWSPTVAARIEPRRKRATYCAAITSKFGRRR